MKVLADFDTVLLPLRSQEIANVHKPVAKKACYLRVGNDQAI